MYPYGMYDVWGVYGIFGLVRSLVVIFIIFLLIRWIFGTHRHWRHGDESKTALDHLKERYAKGEITKKEYQEMKKDLEE